MSPSDGPLRIADAAANAMIAACEAAAPREACGLLVGTAGWSIDPERVADASPGSPPRRTLGWNVGPIRGRRSVPRCEPAEFDSPSVADSSACIATECWPLPNEAADPERGFLMAAGLPPAFRTIRDRGLRLVAYWHSHPQGDAFPSARDRAENLHPDTPHVIVGLPKAIPGSIRAWLGPQLERELRIVVDDSAA